MDPSSFEQKPFNHSDECMNSFDKEDNPIHDEIFSILFPSSPAEGCEEKSKYQFIPEEKSQIVNEETKISDEKTVGCDFISSEKKSTKHSQYNRNSWECKYTENENQINRLTGVNSSNSKNKLLNTNCDQSTNTINLGIVMNKDKFIDTTKEKSNNYLEELSKTKLEPILPTDEDLDFDYSDLSLSDEDHDNSCNKSNINLTDFLLLNETSDIKPSQDSKNNENDSKSKYDYLKNEDTKKKSKSESKEGIYYDTMCEEEIESKDSYLKNKSECGDNRIENDNSFNNQLDIEVSITNEKKFFTKNEMNWKIAKEKKISLNIKKQSFKRDNFMGDVSDEEKEKKFNPQNEHTLEDISDEENGESYKKEDFLEEISDDEETERREWTTGGKINKDVCKFNSVSSASSSILKRLGPVVKPFKSPERKYDEIIIIGDERLPLLRSYKNVQIFRNEGLQLRNVIPFIRKIDLPRDKQYSRMVILCVGLNDIIEKIPSRDCYSRYMGNEKTHSSCYLFRYKTITYNLFSKIMSEVKKITEYLPVSCKVIFSCLYLFDLKMINDNISLEHYHKYDHYPQLSESDIYNNRRIHALIKRVNSRLSDVRNEIINLLDIDEHTMRDYQVTHDINFHVKTLKLMVNNIKKIQSMYSNFHSDDHSSHHKDKIRRITDPKESDIDKNDLRWMLKTRNRRKVLNSKTCRALQTDEKSANKKNNSDKRISSIDTMVGHRRKGCHSPGHCTSPTGWHSVDICRKKEQIRSPRRFISEINKEEKFKKLSRLNKERSIYGKSGSPRSQNTKGEIEREKRYDKNSRSPRRVSSEMSKEEKIRNLSRMTKEGRIYGKTGNSIGKGKEDKIERKSRVSRNLESISTRRGNEGSINRHISEKYEGEKKQSPLFEQCSRKSRSSSGTVEKELDIATCEALRNLAEVHDRSCQMYIDHPAAHPDYNKEYQLFYEAKSQKIREIGGNPLQYDFLPEWQCFWQIRSKEIFREAWLTMKNQCIKMMEEKKLKQEKKNIYEERIIQEDKSHRSNSISSSSSSSRSSSRLSSNTHTSKRKRSSDKRKSDYKKEKKRSEKCHSPPIKKKLKYGENDQIGNKKNLNRMKYNLQLKMLTVKEFKGMDKLNKTNELEMSVLTNKSLKKHLEGSQKTAFQSVNAFNLPLSLADENGIAELGLEEVGESVMPFNLGKYVRESKEKSNGPDNVLDILMMLIQLGDKMGSLVHPIKTLFDKANQENGKNRTTMNIFTDPDASMVMQLVISKLIISINSENTNVIEKVIFEELKNRVDKLMRSVEETFVEGVNIEYIAKKSLGMGSSEIINFIKSVLRMPTSSTFSVDKMMRIYKAIKEKQFKYIESTSNIDNFSDSLEVAFPMQPPVTNNDKDIGLSPTQIPFNLPTRKNSNTAEKYDPFE